MAQLVAQVEGDGPTPRHSLNELLDSHVDHLEHRGREARIIEGYRSIAVQVATDPIGRQPVARISVKAIDDFYLAAEAPWALARLDPALPLTPAGCLPPGHGVGLGHEEPRPARHAAGGPAGRSCESRDQRSSRRSSLRGEVCGIRWSDVDLDRCVIRIRSAIAQLIDGSLVEKEPKGHQQREVSIDSTTSGPASPAPDRTARPDHCPRPSTQLRRLCPR